MSDDLAKRDPYNRLLGAALVPAAAFGQAACATRAFSSSGLLSSKLFGPPVHPPQPVNGLAAAFGASTDWVNSPGEDGHADAPLYTRWRRNLPYPSMLTFDAPEHSVCGMRPGLETNTPLQALVTLNDPVYVEAAQALARRILTEGGATTQARVEIGIRAVLLRSPRSSKRSQRRGRALSNRPNLHWPPTRHGPRPSQPGRSARCGRGWT